MHDKPLGSALERFDDIVEDIERKGGQSLIFGTKEIYWSIVVANKTEIGVDGDLGHFVGRLEW